MNTQQLHHTIPGIIKCES